MAQAKKQKTKKGKYHEWLEKDGQTLLEAWARNGLSNEQIAKNMGIVPSTLYDWKNKYPEISEALSKGKEVVDFEVENALHKIALGYEYEEEILVKVKKGMNEEIQIKRLKKHQAPNVKAIMSWLNNRKPEDWRDKRYEVVEADINMTNDPFDELTVEELKALAKAVDIDE